MKKIFSITHNENAVDLLLLLLRILIGGFMIVHGYPKLMKMLGGDFAFADPFGVGEGVSLALAVFAEFFCSILIILGLGTRLATIPLIITMAVAAFIVHGADPFGKKEMALLYLLFYIVLLVLGSGKYSIDKLFNKEDRLRF